MNKNNILVITTVTALILCVPPVAMQFSDEWDWSFSDFVIMGALIFGTGLLLDWIVRKVDKKHRLIAGAVVVIAFFLVWAELAVGIFNSPIAGS